MTQTNNTIIVHEFVDSRYEMQPVMRNGKPTKKMKEVRIEIYEDLTATGYMINGHELFLLDKDMQDETMYFARTYTADGKRLTCECLFGRYGEQYHTSTCDYFKKLNDLSTHATGYNGATWKGHGARIARINYID